MLDFLVENKTVWENLKTADKPIVLYGMGNGADRILDRCIAEGIVVSGVFASDAFVRGQTFRSYPVCKYEDIIKKYEDFVVVIAFASESPMVLESFYGLADKHETYAPHVALFDGDDIVSFKWLETYEKQLQTVYEHLADERSREVFADILNYKISGKLKYLRHSTSQRQDDFKELFAFGKSEVYVDLGAYDGDTIGEFLRLTEGGYNRIFALEPDKKNFIKLKRFVEQEQLARVTLLNRGIWHESGKQNFFQRGGRMSSLSEKGKASIEVDSLDNILGKETVSYVKMDVEGAEEEALIGGREHLTKYMPKLFIAAYHKDDDLWKIPQLLWNIAPYKLYLRRHPYVPCWEINFLAKK
jgi:FkbM family methyltransferase